jgi:serine/threonine protein kinase
VTAHSSPPATGLVGAVLSRRYRLVRLIGEGGMGSVYAAESLDGAPAVAIKVLRAEFLRDMDVLERFIAEGHTARRLLHPNILRLLDSGQAEDGTPYLVMELLEGVPLSAYTAPGADGVSGRVPLPQAVVILQGILAGLGFAHAQGVVHRDLKPENVFLARDANGQFHVKILDFGISKVMDAAGGMGTKTRTGMLLGTPAYMSPEQIRNSKAVDPRSDLFSAGVMFYEMISGRPAFPAATEFAKLSAVLNAEPTPLDRIDPAFAPLLGFVARAIHKDREQRFATAADMARGLALAMGIDPSSRAAPTPLSRLPEGRSDQANKAGSERPNFHSTLQSTPPPRPPGGTLASGPGAFVSERPPEVVLAPSSEGGPIEVRRGLPSWAIVSLVVGALLAGFLLGFAVAKTL